MPRRRLRNEAIEFRFDYLVTLTRSRLYARPVQHRNMASSAIDQSGFLQIAGGLCYALPADTQHFGNQLVRHDQLVSRYPVEAQQEEPAKLLVNRMIPIADCGLSQLRDKRLCITEQEVEQRTARTRFPPYP
jgi:hypothetical protein